MEQALWKILGFILAVVLIFVAPTITTYDRMDAISYNVVMNEVSRFCEGVRDTGIVSENAYNNLLDTLGKTGVSYDVVLEHYEKTYIPGVTSLGDPMADVAYIPYTSMDIEASFVLTGDYRMSVGDLFYVHVENTSPTKGQSIRQLLLGSGSEYPVIVVRNGGMIRHEPN